MHNELLARRSLLACSVVVATVVFSGELVAQSETRGFDPRVARVDIPLVSPSQPPEDRPTAPPATPAQSAPAPSTRRRVALPAAPRLPGPAALANAAPPLEPPRTAGSDASPAPTADESPSRPAPITPPLVVETDDPFAPLGEFAKPVETNRSSLNRPTLGEPLTLEVIPDGAELPYPRANRDDLPAALGDPTARPRSLPRPRVVDDGDFDDDDDSELSSPTNSRKRKGLLGRLIGREERAIPPAPRGATTRSSRDEPDPREDAEFQRRLEREVRAAAGRHVRDADVIVQGRRVRIRVTADRLWNRRMVRKAIEDLPSLIGYDAIVQVD